MYAGNDRGYVMPIMRLILWIIVCQLPAMAGSAVAAGNYAWYHTLNQPAFTPPDWLFAPVWTILYVLMGVAAFLITRHGLSAQNRTALLVFIVQLAVNALWMPLFFGLHQIGLAFVLLLVLTALAVWTVVLFWKLSRNAGWLLAPYIVWLLFACALNGFIWKLN